jgi:hypothetical protein
MLIAGAGTSGGIGSADGIGSAATAVASGASTGDMAAPTSLAGAAWTAESGASDAAEVAGADSFLLSSSFSEAMLKRRAHRPPLFGGVGSVMWIVRLSVSQACG